MPATLSKISRFPDGKKTKLNFGHGTVEKMAQEAFITELVPYFYRARNSRELRRFFHMVLTIWSDIWPEKSQDRVIVVRNRFNVLTRITSKVLLEGPDPEPMTEWISAALDSVEVEPSEHWVETMFPTEKFDFQAMAAEIGIWEYLSINAQAALEGRQPSPEGPAKFDDDNVHDSVTRIDFLTPDPNPTIPFEFEIGTLEETSMPWDNMSPKAKELFQVLKKGSTSDVQLPTTVA